MNISDTTRERIATALAWLVIIVVSALAVFMLWLTLWTGCELGLKM